MGLGRVKRISVLVGAEKPRALVVIVVGARAGEIEILREVGTMRGGELRLDTLALLRRRDGERETSVPPRVKGWRRTMD